MLIEMMTANFAIGLVSAYSAQLGILRVKEAFFMHRKAPLVVAISVLFFFSLVVLRLTQLMLIEGEELAVEAEEQQTRSLDYYQYIRGDIVDRYGRSFTNVPENCLVVFPAMVREPEAAIELLSEVLNLPLSSIRACFSANYGQEPYIFKTGLDARQAEQIIDAELPGLTCLQLAARYSDAHPAVHLIGSCRKVDDTWQGLNGLELQYNAYLQGRQGRRLLAYVDADGQLSLADLFVREGEEASNTLRLTLDMDYQQIAENAFRSLGYSGACVIMDPENGDVLTAASVEGYDPYYWQEAAEDAYVNKVFALYHPASSFKTLLAAAALNEGLPLPGWAESQQSLALSAEAASGETAEGSADFSGAAQYAEQYEQSNDEAFVCSGKYNFAPEHTVACTAAADGHGEVDLCKALASSCNCYFVALGQSLGGELIREYCDKLGLCSQQLIGYELNDYAESDYLQFSDSVPADIANLSLGERGVMISPLQEAVLYAAVVNGGYRVCPRLVCGVSDSQGRTLVEYPEATKTPVLKSAVAEQLREMLIQSVEEGTAASLSDCPISAGGKTGTSESGGVWFSGFAPAEQPRWVIVVHVDQGVAGGVEATAVFRRILEDICLLEGN